jgi:GH24 family phage-related lysozyme (muramidase)
MRLIFGFLFLWACRNDAPVLNSDPDYYPATINEIIRREGYTVKSGHGDKYHKTVKTRLDALKLLQNRIDSIYNKVGNEAPILTRNQKLAVTSLVYNIGFAKLKKMRLWQSIKQGKTNFQDWIEICYFNNNGKKVKSANLRKSRQFEIELFNEK